MRTKEEKSQYDMAFIRTKCAKKTVLFHLDKDSDILEYIGAKTGNFNAYIKGLIRADMETKKEEKS